MVEKKKTELTWINSTNHHLRYEIEIKNIRLLKEELNKKD
jgi:hypothetical protein